MSVGEEEGRKEGGRERGGLVEITGLSNRRYSCYFIVTLVCFVVGRKREREREKGGRE